MKKFIVENRKSGCILGSYMAETEHEAIRLMLKDAGYDEAEPDDGLIAYYEEEIE
jgi:hypothetical protein